MEFEDIYNTYFRDVYLYLLRLSCNKDIAEEVTSEAFFKALRSIDSFRGECSISTWLCQIAKNCYYSYLKKNSRLESLDDNVGIVAQGQDPEAIAIDHDMALHIRRHLHELPETYKEVFMWRVLAELSFSEIGALFGKTANWACVTYHRARKMIQKGMEVDENEK